MAKLSKIRDNEMIMISRMRDTIYPRKKRLNLEEEKVDVASMHLEGDALDFYSWVSTNQTMEYWKDLVRVTPPNGAWTESASEGVTYMNITSASHTVDTKVGRS